MPGQNKTYCQDESGNYGKTIWQYRWPTADTKHNRLRGADLESRVVLDNPGLITYTSSSLYVIMTEIVNAWPSLL